MNNTIDKKYMNKAIELAKNGKYRTHPNPLVGAVIVKNDKIISKGYHKRFRGKHAEREAIDKSKESLKGSTMYVTLEPCVMCFEALIMSRISKIVYSVSDPKKGGISTQLKKKHKILISSGILQKKSLDLIQRFFKKKRIKFF